MEIYWWHCPNHNMSALQVGGVENHVHALIVASPTIAPSQIAQLIKGESSKWYNEEFTKKRRFGWQDGYGAFSVSKSNSESVINYIKNQREHHKKQSFEDEYEEMLRKHEISYDAKYMFG